MYDFNEIINRKNTNAIKYDFNARYGKPENMVPLWIADMDFAVAPEITTTIQAVVDHGIYGYTDSSAEYDHALITWYAQRHQFTIDPSWVVKTPGITFALGMAIKAFTEPGDAILIQTPLYPPIAHTVKLNDRVCVENILINQRGYYTIDFDDFEQQIIKQHVKMFILCSPHNPVGRVWTVDELKQMADICKRHDVLVVSDEIHCDLIMPGFTHHVFSKVCPDVPCILMTAPSKTFNLAGLQCSNIIINDADLRKKYEHEILKTGYHQLNVMGIAACTAALTQGHQWLEQLTAYLDANRQYVIDFCEKHLPFITVTPLEGSYLMWLDFNKMHVPQTLINEFSHSEAYQKMTANIKLSGHPWPFMIKMLDDAGVWPSPGNMFGTTGEGFFRFNIACPRKTLEAGLNCLRSGGFHAR